MAIRQPEGCCSVGSDARDGIGVGIEAGVDSDFKPMILVVYISGLSASLLMANNFN